MEKYSKPFQFLPFVISFLFCIVHRSSHLIFISYTITTESVQIFRKIFSASNGRPASSLCAFYSSLLFCAHLVSTQILTIKLFCLLCTLRWIVAAVRYAARTYYNAAVCYDSMHDYSSRTFIIVNWICLSPAKNGFCSMFWLTITLHLSYECNLLSWCCSLRKITAASYVYIYACS